MLQKVSRRPAAKGHSVKKAFSLNEILSLITGLPLAQEGQAAVHRLVAFVMETEASSASTQANAETVKACIEAQLPFLKDMNLTGLYQIYQYADDGDAANPYLEVWMEMQMLRYGAEHELLPFRRWNAQQRDAAREQEEREMAKAL